MIEPFDNVYEAAAPMMGRVDDPQRALPKAMLPQYTKGDQQWT
jgi:hypothetical protein